MTTHGALIPREKLVEFVHDTLGLDKAIIIQELKKRFGLLNRQAHNQYNNRLKPILESLGLTQQDASHNSPPLDVSQFGGNSVGLEDLQRPGTLEELTPPPRDETDQMTEEQPPSSPFQLGQNDEFNVETKVAKYFVKFNAIYLGTVASYDSKSGWFKVEYDDGDGEEMDADEVQSCVQLHVALRSHLETGDSATSIALSRNVKVPTQVPSSTRKRKRQTRSTLSQGQRECECNSFSNSWDGQEGGQYLSYHLRNIYRYGKSWDPNTDSIVDGQKKGHPLRNHQPQVVKNAHRGVTDAAYFADGAINVAVSKFEGENLLIVHKGLHHVPHGLGFLQKKGTTDVALRNNGVNVIDVPERMKKFCLSRMDDGVNIFRNGTAEAESVSMTSAAKRGLLNFLIDDKCKKFLSDDAGRDVGSNVHRYDLMFNQAQGCCDQYSDANGNIIKGSDGLPLRVPLLRKHTEMLLMMTDEVKGEFTQVLTGMDTVTQQVYPDAFSDERRQHLVYKYFARKYLGEEITINWEYVGIIARKVTDKDCLAMHVDAKNDWRSGYDYCSTYSYVLDGYRVTIVAACKQDFGGLMKRLNEVEVEGGRFLPPKKNNK